MGKQKKSHLFKRFKPKLGTITIILVLIFFIVLLFGTNAMKIYNLKRQKASIEAQLSDADKKSEQLDDAIKQIGTKNYIELIARKYLGLYYPDEKIVVPVEGKDNNSEPTKEPTVSTEEKKNTDSSEKQGETN